MGESKNPFVYGRSEFETNPTFYVPPAITEWVSRQPIIFEGLRGSGKSSILKFLTWEVAWEVAGASVHGPATVRKIFSSPKHLGVYFRAEEMDVGYWKSWRMICGDDCAQKYFGTYIEFIYLDLFLNALQGIRVTSRKYLLNAQSEINFVKEMIKICFPSEEYRPSLYDISFESFRSIVRDTHIGIRALVYRKVEEKSMLETYPILGPGSIIQSFGKLFVEYYPELSDWTLMPLLDDCNYLTEWQTRVINSSIVKSKAPIAYKLTSVKGLHKSRLTIDNRPVNDHELRTIYISGDSPTNWHYKNMVQGVCRARISQFYGKEKSSRFDFWKILGPFNLQDLLIIKLKTSQNESSLKLLKQAEAIAKTKNRPVSITSYWLTDMKVREEKETTRKDPLIQKQMIRRGESIYKRKWNHVAAAAICREFKLEFPYCGWKVVLHLSCGSIREMLRIMFEIWEKAKIDIDKFLTQNPLNINIQIQAIKKASLLSFDSLDKKPIFEKSSLPKICERLGYLFSKFQSDPYIYTTPESASLKTKFRKLDYEIIDIINFSVMTGVMLKKEVKDTIEIGLHPILAPKFGMSFRSPFYYPESISNEQMKILFKGSDGEAHKVIKQILYKRLLRYNKKYNKNIKNGKIQFESSTQTEFEF